MQQLLKLFFILQTAVRGEPFIGEVTQPRLLSVLTGESVTINCTWIYNGTNHEWIHANFQREPLLGNKNSCIKKLTCVRDVTLGSFGRCFTSLEIENVSIDHSQNKYTHMVKLPKVYPPLESKGQGTRLQIYGEPFIGEVTQPRLLSVLTGESVTINCTWIYNGTNNEWIHANFQREPLLGNKNSSNKKLTCVRDVTLGSFGRCFTSLEIENVSFDHSQYNYICMVKLPKVYPPLERRGQGTRLQIYEMPEISIIGGSLVAGQKSVLTCSAQGLYSENISFTWTCNGINMMTNIPVPTLKGMVHGKPNATSKFEIIPQVIDHGTVCTCQINHVTFKQPLTERIKLDVKYGPLEPTIMYKLKDTYHVKASNGVTVPSNSPVELRCSVDSNPVATVIWLKNGKNLTSMIENIIRLNSSILTIPHFQPKDAGVYWCVANNSYGWRNGSVSLMAFQKDHLLLYILSSIIGVIGLIGMIAIYVCLIWKRQLKGPVNVPIEPSPETMIKNEKYNTESDTIYAFVRRNNLQSNPKHATDPVNEYSNLEEGEEVSYADIVIHNPRRQCYDQQPKQVSNVTEKNARKDFKYMHGSSPFKHIDDTSEYSVVRISHQDLRTV
ncbi:sialic acid-binding Ig-like lectin 8 isoform X2 [Hemiscyllium ocellatum]|uniref:sialic acid-binding Ig-like lectin 8 isoform X2 n=1 Tax=Hemiscyllium ocellatum TaxID=170820 RepID=UPI0029666313|nr:sialic acid-binding Ig-like lectin 8 isoform X2 [Hemiscyllium ocellatum]